MIKKTISIILALCIFVTNIPVTAYASEQNSTLELNQSMEETNSVGEVGGYLASNPITVKRIDNNHMFTAQQGHGFAAERANNLYDAYKGIKGTVVGDDFIENGPDRKIINREGTIFIQDKYCKSAKDTVNAAFDENGAYKYLDKNGNPMKLEVPKDQYDDAVKLMELKIKEGRLKTVKDPNEAKNIVKKGNVTYKQAVNIAKTGTVDSLKYDAANGVVSAGCAAGISFVLDYVICRMNGLTPTNALDTAIKNGLKTGGVVFASFVISSQIARTGITNAFTPTSQAIAKALGKEVCEAIMTRTGMEVTGKTAATVTAKVADILSRELITDAVIVVVLTGMDVVDMFRGRISEEELLKNLAITLVSVGVGTVGGYAGSAVGNIILPGAGAVVGGILGSTIGGGLAAIGGEFIASKIYKSDAEEMFDIISEQFLVMGEEYIITESEGNLIAEELRKVLVGDVLKDMHASEDRVSFATELLEPLFDNQVAQRKKISLPTEAELRWEYKDMMQGVVFVH